MLGNGGAAGIGDREGEIVDQGKKLHVDVQLIYLLQFSKFELNSNHRQKVYLSGQGRKKGRGKTNKQTNKRTNKRTNKQKNRTNKQTNKQTEQTEQTEQTNKQVQNKP